MQSKFLRGICTLLIGAIGANSFGQAPQQFNYQAVIRDEHGQPMANKSIQLRLRIRNGSANGAANYTEVRSVTTNEFGLVAVAVNSPGADLQQGSMGLVDWANGAKFLQVEVDHDKDGTFTDMGATQILSAPYAMFAAPAGNAAGDLAGKYPNPTVNSIQGKPVDMSGNLYHGYTLKWDQVNNKWVPGKDEDGGPDFYFKASKGIEETVHFKPYIYPGFFSILNQNPLTAASYNATNLLRFPHTISDVYGVFDDSVFTAPTDGMYELEAVVHFMRVHPNMKPPLYPNSCWMGVFKNGEYVGMAWTSFKSEDEADLKPMRLHKVIYLQKGDKIIFRFSHSDDQEALLGYTGTGPGNMNYYVNQEAMYITGRRLR